MIRFECKGEWKKTFNFLEKVTDVFGVSLLDKYGKKGVKALAAATPVDTGKTADSWYYEIKKYQDGDVKIIWNNSSTTDSGIPIVVLLQYGHGTRNGGYVEGRDFINPAIQPVFDEIAKAAWKEVKDL